MAENKEIPTKTENSTCALSLNRPEKSGKAKTPRKVEKPSRRKKPVFEGR